MQISELTRDAKDSIIHERNKNGLFTSFHDFLRRMSGHIHLQDVKALIKAGAIDAIGNGINRPGLVWQALEFFDKQEDKAIPTLFDYGKKNVPARKEVLKREDYSGQVMLKNESDALGFIISMPPLELYNDLLKDIHYIQAKDLPGLVGRYVTMTGWLVTGKTVMTKEGDQMKFVSFEETTGIYEAVFFPKVYNTYCHMLNAARPYILKGKVDMDFVP
jgi:error-prone DNA polymerase